MRQGHLHQARGVNGRKMDSTVMSAVLARAENHQVGKRYKTPDVVCGGLSNFIRDSRLYVKSICIDYFRIIDMVGPYFHPLKNLPVMFKADIHSGSFTSIGPSPVDYRGPSPRDSFHQAATRSEWAVDGYVPKPPPPVRRTPAA